jgi:hypothetical protein
MSVTYFIKNGFANIRTLMTSICADLTDPTVTTDNVQYFEGVYPFPFDPLTIFPSGTAYPAGNVVILESKLAVDPMANVETVSTPTGSINAAWRLGFVLHNDVTLTLHAGSRLNLPGMESGAAAGKLTFLTNRASNPDKLEFREPPGCVNIATWTEYNPSNYKIFGNVLRASIPGRTAGAGDAVLPGPNVSIPNEVFLSRISSIGAEGSYPMNYSLTLANRGMVLCVWEDNQEEISETVLGESGHGQYTDTDKLSKVYGNSPVRWVVFQRAVDRESGFVRGGRRLRGNLDFKTGTVINETSRCPVFCVFGNSNPAEYKKFIVRENDVLTPSPKRSASVNTVDSPAILNPLQQQSVTEQGEFVVTFLNNLATSRFRYGDELDLIGTVGAEVVGGGTNIKVKVYSDNYERTYSALYANKQYGGGMRIMVLTAANSDDESKNTEIRHNHPRQDYIYTVGYVGPYTAAPSDMRLKSNIVRVGTLPIGIGIYEYDIFDRREVGVMAQEVLLVKPEAVLTHEQGYYLVDYSKIDFERTVKKVYH